MNQQSDTADLLGGYVLCWQSDLTKSFTKKQNINIKLLFSDIFWQVRHYTKTWT